MNKPPSTVDVGNQKSVGGAEVFLMARRHEVKNNQTRRCRMSSSQTPVSCSLLVAWLLSILRGLLASTESCFCVPLAFRFLECYRQAGVSRISFTLHFLTTITSGMVFFSFHYCCSRLDIIIAKPITRTEK